MEGSAMTGMEYALDDLTAELIQPVLNAMALRTVPCADETTPTVPLEAEISVPLLSLGAEPSRVYRMFAPAVAVVMVTVVGVSLGYVPPSGLMERSATWDLR